MNYPGFNCFKLYHFMAQNHNFACHKKIPSKHIALTGFYKINSWKK